MGKAEDLKNNSQEKIDIEVGMFNENEDIQEIKRIIYLGYATTYKNQGPTSKPYFPEDYEQKVSNKEIRLFIAKAGNEIVGSV